MIPRSVGLLYKDIVEIGLEDKEQIYKNKERSVVGRALVGSLIAGPVGAIVGGMTGLNPKVEKVDMPDILITIRYKDDQAKTANAKAENDCKECPYCAEKVKTAAKKCRYCGEWFSAQDKVILEDNVILFMCKHKIRTKAEKFFNNLPGNINLTCL